MGQPKQEKKLKQAARKTKRKEVVVETTIHNSIGLFILIYLAI